MKGGFYFAPIKNMSASKQKKTTHKKGENLTFDIHMTHQILDPVVYCT